MISSDAFKTHADILTRSRLFWVISRLSRGCQYLPRSYYIDSKTITLCNLPYTSGSCSEVYRGTQNGQSVAVKVLRTVDQESLTKLEKVSTGPGIGHNAWTRADMVRNSAFARRRSCGNTSHVRISSSSTAYLTTMEYPRSSRLGCLMGISSNIWRRTLMRIDCVW